MRTFDAVGDIFSWSGTSRAYGDRVFCELTENEVLPDISRVRGRWVLVVDAPLVGGVFGVWGSV